MKYRLLAIVALVLSANSLSLAWGVWGHNHINKGAVLALPQEMGMFFYDHADFLIQESTIPDLRKYTLNDKTEGPRHYIDLELFNYRSAADMPTTMSEMVAKYGKDSLDKYGILPWYVQDMMVKLTNAFKKKNRTEILFLAGDLGHYLGDAQMPLHTSVNHNGQLTGQVGIHAFWETQLPEMFGHDYNLYTGEAHYIADIPGEVWRMVDSTHRLVATLLEMDNKTRKDIPEDRWYEKGADGQIKKNSWGATKHSPEYAEKFHNLLNGMVEAQLKNGIRHTADFWYTAWVNAGKPDLSGLDEEDVTKRNVPLYKSDISTWKKTGKISGCRSEKEFQ